MSESAPLNVNKPNYLFIVLVAILALEIGAFFVLNYVHNKIISANKSAIVKVIKAPVVIASEQPTYEQVVATPIIKVVPTVQVPVKSVPVVTTTLVAPVHVVVSHPVISAIYLNHGNFLHGNSNPNWSIK
jgi:hypothetical protein